MLSYCLARPHPDFSLCLVSSAEALLRLGFDDLRPEPAWSEDDNHPVFREAIRQLELYFAGNLRTFDLPLQLEGTPYQRRVWRALLEIPYGETRSYRDLARSLSPPSVPRAVGQANAANPIGIIVPCHRVIAADGSLGGWYSSHLPLKRFLLDLEQRIAG